MKVQTQEARRYIAAKGWTIEEEHVPDRSPPVHQPAAVAGEGGPWSWTRAPA
jgi:hypothetical protein